VATGGVTEAQSVQFWYAMLTSELRNRVRSVMLLKSEAPTLKTVFELVELNIVEEQVHAIALMTKSTTTSQAKKVVSGGKPSKQEKPAGTKFVPSYAGQSSSNGACYKCGRYGHIARDCPKKFQQGSTGGQQEVVQCDNCGK
jgi:hypothetical protein